MGSWYAKVQLNIYRLLDKHPPIYMTFFNSDDILTSETEMSIFIGNIDEIGMDEKLCSYRK